MVKRIKCKKNVNKNGESKRIIVTIKAKSKKKICRDCDCCNLVTHKRWNPSTRIMEDVQVYECFGVKEPFKISNIDMECNQY